MGRDGWILIASVPLLPVALESVVNIFCLKVGRGKFQASRYLCRGFDFRGETRLTQLRRHQVPRRKGDATGLRLGTWL
jgi:hypothetical protein